MTLDEIKAATLEGKLVHWGSPAYEVRHDPAGIWLIACLANNQTIGLTDASGAMNGKPKDFFLDQSYKSMRG